MRRKEELKEIIRLNQDPADWGHTQAQFNVIQAEEELAEIEKIETCQLVMNLESEEL
jgi:hypothetical protein